MFDKIAVLPIDQMLDDLRQALASLRALLESQDLRGAVSVLPWRVGRDCGGVGHHRPNPERT